MGARAREISDIRQKMDVKFYSEAVELILEAERGGKRVHVTGIGKPARIAGYAASVMSSTETPAYILHGTEVVHGSAGQVLPGDVVIASRETFELQAAVTTLKQRS